MSGKHWLEREPQDSPGLQRIREAQQAVVAAKAHEEKRSCEAKIVAQEAEQKRLEMLARIEQKTAEILPVLKEVRNFANTTKTFPLGIISNRRVKITDPLRIVVTPKITNADGFSEIQLRNGFQGGEIQLRYGFEGLEYREGNSNDFGTDPDWDEKTSVLFGIRLKVDVDKVSLFRKIEKEVFHPASGPHTIVWGRGGSTQYEGHEPYTEIEYGEEWQQLPDDKTKLKSELAAAFHDPVYLGTEPLPLSQEVASQSEPRAGTGITGLVKGFLGLK